MKQRFYFDTSVFGGVFDIEFEEATLQLFERVKLGTVVCVYSDLTETELVKAPEKVREYFKICRKKNRKKLKFEMKQLIWQQNILKKKLLEKRVLTIVCILQLQH